MQAIEILDIKPFMQLLFQTAAFDSYELVSANVHTDISYSIDGKWNSGFYHEEERLALELDGHAFFPWRYGKEKIFSLIKGKKTPMFLKLVLKADSSQTADFLSAANLSLNSNDIDGFFLNITFQGNKLNVTCGISYKIFTIDKTLENYFSEEIVTLLKSNSIACKM